MKTAKDWIDNNCKFAALSNSDQARSEVVGVSQAVVKQYQKYKATKDQHELSQLLLMMESLSSAVAKVGEASKLNSQPVIEQAPVSPPVGPTV